MNKILNRTAQFILSPQKTILASALIIGSMIIISRIFGFVRYRTLATYFSKEELDLFFAAFRIPDFIYEILISGAFAATFVPIFIKYENDKEGFNVAMNSILNVLFVALALLAALLFIITQPLVNVMTPGLTTQNKEVIVLFSQVLLVTQLPFLILGSIMSGIAQSKKRFLLSSAAPVLYNIGIIAGTVVFSKHVWLYGPLIGVSFGSILFAIVQIPLLSVSGFTFRWFICRVSIIKEFISLYIPRILTIITAQIDLTVDLALSTVIGPGNYTVFYFAQHLSLFPVSVIGMAFGQAALPYITDLYKNRQIERIKNIVAESLLQLFFTSIPFAIFFTFSRTPITRFFYGGERFDWNGTVLTAITLSFFSLSIPFHTVFYFITRCFYALFDTKTPFFISGISVLINICISFISVYVIKLPVWSLGIAFSISMAINVSMLLVALSIKLGGLPIKKIVIGSSKIIICALLSAVPSYALIKILDGLVLDTTRTINLIILLILTATLYMLLYGILCWILNVEELYMLQKVAIKVKELKKRITNYYTDIG
jgi:putative peptidoglycan lipid II flippase